VDKNYRALRRAFMVGTRNLGNNWFCVAWDQSQSIPLFHLKGEPITGRTYSCFVYWEDGSASIEKARFVNESVHILTREAAQYVDCSHRVRFCFSSQQILRHGRPVPIYELIGDFYDIRHVLAFENRGPDDSLLLMETFWSEGFAGFKDRALKCLEEGWPRSCYLHSCLGLSADNLFILQAHGTIEQIAQWVLEAGGQDAILLDNGASPFCWAWWPYAGGGYIFNSLDWREPTISSLAFILHGPVSYEERRGRVPWKMA
jgi:hypothetical protein